jgi:fatty acid amide hydrolase
MSLSARALVAAMKDGRLTAEEVMMAYVRTSYESDMTTRAMTADRYEAALSAARRADRAAEAVRAGKVKRGKDGADPLGPLHGLPFSVKESLSVEGWDSTLGVSRRAFQPYESSALVVEALVAAGAIPFAQTNVPQTLLSFECANPVYGATSNPWDSSRVPGGSSGGEAALLAMDGSPVGIGTDIGGSVRIPAAYCGVVGFKPTRDRISVVGGVTAIPGQEGVPGVIGPLGRTVDDLALILETWCGELVYENDRIPPLPFDTETYRARDHPLRIGYFTHDGIVDAHPAYRRAVEEAAAALTAAGHTLVRFNVPAWDDEGDAAAPTGAPVVGTDGHVHPHCPEHSFLDKFFALVAADGGETLLKELRGEYIQSNLALSVKSIRTPAIVKSAIAALLRLAGQGRIATLATALRTRSVAEYYRLLHGRNTFRARFRDAFQTDGLDALLSPAHALPAVPHNSTGDLSPTCSYTMLYNILDWPAGVVPVTTVSAKDEAAACDPSAGGSWIARDRLSTSSARAARGTTGLPIAVQVAARPFREETCLRVMAEIEELMPFRDENKPGVNVDISA